MKRGLIAILLASLYAGIAEAGNIRNVRATQNWAPWNNKVDIEFVVSSDLPPNAFLGVSAEDLTTGVTYTAQENMLLGDTLWDRGSHHVIWDVGSQGISIQSTNVVFSVDYHPAKYCVIDLSAGANATEYPVTFMDTEPSESFNTNLYKKERLVLRCVDSGTFMMCDTYQVTLTKPFYIGIYEVTEYQYQRVMGDKPTNTGPLFPVRNISWNTLRGGNWPTPSSVDNNSFVGRLRTKTGLNFDLPTEAQWEYACRAGTTSAYNNGGDTEDDLKLVGTYNGNQGYFNQVYVGSLLPNAWGIYDMHGNVREWCLDWDGNLENDVTNPSGPPSGTSRIQRGGCAQDSAESCTSSSRRSADPSRTEYNTGFRIVCPLPR